MGEKLSRAQKSHLSLLVTEGPYWYPANSGEWSVARVLERKGFVKFSASRGQSPYELTEAGRLAASPEPTTTEDSLRNDKDWPRDPK